MEVAIANNQTTTTTTTANTTNAKSGGQSSLSGVRSPFQREVREWQRIDPATGALLTGRLEADCWINGPMHSYGKKSSSSVSSNSNSSTANMQNFSSSSNNNNNNPSIAHGSGSKVSLHAIVGSNSNNSTLLSTSSSVTSSFNTTATTTANTAWQRQQQQPQHRHSRLFEQLPTFGKINSITDFAKSRVGDAGAGADDCAEAKFDDRVTFNSTATTTTISDERSTLQLTPTHLQRRKVLESFRHYNDDQQHHQQQQQRHYHHDDRGDHKIKNIDNNDDDDDADMRLSSRYQRRQQLPISSPNFTSFTLHRGRSISTDDLSTEWDPQSDDTTIDEPGEWKRVSKLRRSFQSPATTHSTTSDTTTPRRPLDLPASSVSVSKIRAELEQGRRLNTAMRNNNVDMAALQSILNPTSSNTVETKPVPAQRSSFLTADSLKEIRNNLKKLSDESLYKDDFLLGQTAPVEHLEIHEVKTKPALKTPLHRITPERSIEVTKTTPSAFKLVVGQKQSSPPAVSFQPTTSKQHTTHSLESRQKYRDTSSAEWHMRRKSYGFEKMLPTEESNMFRMDASTDSGLGRSSELNAWSPTETVPAARSTVVHFGESSRVTGLLQRRYKQQPNSPEAGSSSDEQKRHSIAFDDSQIARKTSQVRINGVGQAELELASSSQPQSYDTDSPTNGNSATQYFQRSQQKRVEFCKTEVHFAAESGRVNIVETDGKPPPTNNFRRKRRTTTGPLQSLVKGASTTNDPQGAESKSSVALPITRFGDDNRPRTLASTTVAYKASLVESKTENFEPSNVTITLPKIAEGLSAGSRNSYASTSGIDTTDNETDDIAGIRGILKNKPMKPKPYHLGENFETPDALWGVQLKPVGGQQLRKEGAVEMIPTRDSPPMQASSKSVTDRVHNVEKRLDLSSTVQHNGYSTKINLSLGETAPDWKEQGLNGIVTHTTLLHPVQPRPSTQQLILNELKEHQKILDEGLKSTSLIMKTMRSANEFDEAMRRLSIASLETSSIPPIVVPTPMLRSHSYQETPPKRCESNSEMEIDKNSIVKSASYGSSTTFSSNRVCCDATSHQTPTIAPRLKLIGKTEVPVSQQLSQLRRLYEVAARKEEDDSNDSADEEVKRYFNNHPDNSDSGGGTQESSSLEDNRAFEYTTSWSRLKAKRTVWQIEADEARQAGETKMKTDLPKSNIMSIALHSPQATLEKTQPQPPVAKPRTTTTGRLIQSTDSAARESLRIVKEARGARKLREHELSFFGVPIANSKAATQQTATTTTTSTTKRTLPQRPRFREETTHNSSSTLKEAQSSNEAARQSSKWKLTHDRPDLLHHTEQHSSNNAVKDSHSKKKSFSPVNRIQYSDEEEEDTETEHFYENLTNDLDAVMPQKAQSMQSAKAYSRQRDLARDERILSEMTHNADQTMKALNDEALLKDQRRRSLSRRNSKPLETIIEKSMPEKINDKCIAVTVTRSTLASEAKRQSSHATRQAALSPSSHSKTSRIRTSSQSSVESGSRPRSRSLSSEREYEQTHAKLSARASTKQTRHVKPSSRSSSRDSQRSTQTLGSSGDEHCKRDERLRTKPKRSSNFAVTKAATEKLSTKEHDRRERDAKISERSQQRSSRSLKERTPTHRGESSSKSKSKSTTRSSQRECVECITDVNHTTTPPLPQTSTRRHRNENDKRNSAATSRSTAIPVDKLEARSSGRLVRAIRSSHDHDSSQRSSNRSERSTSEKDKLSRSRGHSSRSAAHSNDNSKTHQHHHHNQESTHHSHQHTSSPSGTSRTRSSSEHRKVPSATAAPPSSTADNSQTHSKNASALNGISSQRQHHHHHQHHQHHQQQQPIQHIHSLTAATIATKERERSGKDRK